MRRILKTINNIDEDFEYNIFELDLHQIILWKILGILLTKLEFHLRKVDIKSILLMKFCTFQSSI